MAAQALSARDAERLEKLLEQVNGTNTSDVVAALQRLGAGRSRDKEAKDETLLVEVYLASSPNCADLLALWDDVLAGKSKLAKTGEEAALSSAIMEALSAVLLFADDTKFMASKRALSRTLLKNKTRAINAFLNTTQDVRLLKHGFRLLTGLAKQGHAFVRELLFKVQLNTPPILKHANKSPGNADAGGKHAGSAASASQPSRFGSSRHRLMQLAIALLANADVNVKKRLIEPRGLVQSLFKLLSGDPLEMASSFLAALRTHVLADPGVGYRSKRDLFHPHTTILLGLLPMYGNPALRQLVHGFLSDLLLSETVGLFPTTRAAAAGPRRLKAPPSAGAAPPGDEVDSEEDEGGDDAATTITAMHHTAALLAGGGAELARRKRARDVEGDARRFRLVVANALASLDDELQAHLLFSMLHADLGMIERYLNSAVPRLNLEPRPAFRWIRSVGQLRRLLDLPLPEPPQTLHRFRLVDAAAGRTLGASDTAALEAASEQVLAGAIPSPSALSKALLSRGAQHASPLVVAFTLDVVMLILDRVERAIGAALAIVKGAAEATRLRNQLRNKVAQRLPSSSVLVALLAGTRPEQRSDVEHNWVRLRAARALLSFARVVPGSLVGNLDLGKLLASQPAPSPADADIVQLMTTVSLLQMIPMLPLQQHRWASVPTLKTVLTARAAVACRALVTGDSASQQALDRTLVSTLLALLALDPEQSENSVHAQAWVHELRTPEDASTLAPILAAAMQSTASVTAQVLLDEAIAKETDNAAFVFRVLVRLALSLGRPTAVFGCRPVCEWLGAAADRETLLVFVHTRLGVSLPRALNAAGSREAVSSPDDSNVLALDRPNPRAALKAASRESRPELLLAHALSTKRADALLAPKLAGGVYWDRLCSQARAATDDQVAALVSLACNLAGHHLASHGALLETDSAALFELFERAVLRRPALAEHIFQHRAFEDPLRLVAPVRARLAALAGTAASLEMPERDGAVAAFAGKLLAALESVDPNSAEGEAVAADLVRLRRVLPVHLAQVETLVEQESFVAWRGGPTRRALSLLLLGLATPTPSALRHLFRIAQEHPSPAVDRALLAMTRALVDTSSPVARASASATREVLQDANTKEALLALLAQPTADRVLVAAVVAEAICWVAPLELACTAAGRDSASIAVFWPLWRVALEPTGGMCNAVRAALGENATSVTAMVAAAAAAPESLGSGAFMAIAQAGALAPGADTTAADELAERLLKSEAPLGAEQVAFLEAMAVGRRPLLKRVASELLARLANVDDESVDAGSAFARVLTACVEKRVKLDVDQLAALLAKSRSSKWACFCSNSLMEKLGDSLGSKPVRALCKAYLDPIGLATRTSGSRGTELARLWLALATRKPRAACTSDHFAAARQAYGGTLAEVDCILRRLFVVFEDSVGLTLASSGFAVGERAFKQLEVPLPHEDSGMASRGVLAQAVAMHYDWLVNADFRPALADGIPLHRSLRPDSPTYFCSSALSTAPLPEQSGASSPSAKRRKLDAAASETFDEFFKGDEQVPTKQPGSAQRSDAEEDDDGEPETAAEPVVMDTDDDEGGSSADESGLALNVANSKAGKSAEQTAPADPKDRESLKAAAAHARAVEFAAEERELAVRAGFRREALDPSFWLPALHQYLELRALIADLPSHDADRDDDQVVSDDDDDEEEDNQVGKGGSGDRVEDKETLEIREQFAAAAAGAFPARKLIETGAVAFLFWCAASRAEDTRRLACSALQVFGQLAAREYLFRERLQLVALLGSVRAALPEVASPVTSLVASFATESLDILLKPGGTMYKAVNRFIMERPWVGMHEVPMFLQAFNSGKPTFRVERGWAARVLCRGLRSREDVSVAFRQKLPGMLMSFFDAGDMVDVYMQEQAVLALLAIARVGKFGVRRLLKAGVLVWACNALSSIASVAAASGHGEAGLSVRQEAVVCELLELVLLVARETGDSVRELSAARSSPQEEGPLLRDAFVDGEALLGGELVVRSALEAVSRCSDTRAIKTLLQALLALAGRANDQGATKRAAGTTDFDGALEIPTTLLARLIEVVASRVQPSEEVAGLALQLVQANRCVGNVDLLAWGQVWRWALDVNVARLGSSDLSGEESVAEAASFLVWSRNLVRSARKSSSTGMLGAMRAVAQPAQIASLALAACSANKSPVLDAVAKLERELQLAGQ